MPAYMYQYLILVDLYLIWTYLFKNLNFMSKIIIDLYLKQIPVLTYRYINH